VAVQATVQRDGAIHSVPIDRLVPGDIVELIPRDLITANVRMLESRNLAVNQALLTWQPYPGREAGKRCGAGHGKSGRSIEAVFASTSVISGTVTAIM
jgi:Mg2+-importing ATPase